MQPALLQKYPDYARNPQDEEHQLFYAYLDTGQYQAARHYLAQMTRNVPSGSLRLRLANRPAQRSMAYRPVAHVSVFAGNPCPAASRSRGAPSGCHGTRQPGLQIDYAALLQARGLPRAAEQKLKMAEVLEPSNTELEQQQAYVAMDLQEWRQMELLTDDVLARAPRDRSVQRPDRLRNVHHMSELRLNAGKGLHSDNPVSGTHDLNWDATLYGPPVADNWRLFGGTRFAEGNFDEGKGTSRHLVGGVEWRSRDIWLEAELSGNRYHGTHTPALASPVSTA